MTVSQTIETPTKINFRNISHKLILVKGIEIRKKIPAKTISKPKLQISVNALSRTERTGLSVISMAISPIIKKL